MGDASDDYCNPQEARMDGPRLARVVEILEQEGYVLLGSPDTDFDRGTHTIIYRCCRVTAGTSGSAAQPPSLALNNGEEGEKGRQGLVDMARVKVLDVSLPLPRHLRNFQHEHQVVEESLRGVVGVVRVLSRISRPGVEALIIEDFGGESLDKWLERDGPMASDLERFLEVALSVARTLGLIHGRSVVHRDIKVHHTLLLCPPPPPSFLLA
jgi:hypothetical protein